MNDLHHHHSKLIKEHLGGLEGRIQLDFACFDLFRSCLEPMGKGLFMSSLSRIYTYGEGCSTRMLPSQIRWVESI